MSDINLNFYLPFEQRKSIKNCQVHLAALILSFRNAHVNLNTIIWQTNVVQTSAS